MSENATEWFGMRVTPTQKEKIKRLAERRGTTQKAAVLEAVERKLAEDGAEEAQPESALEQIADLVDVEPEPGSVLALTRSRLMPRPEGRGGIRQSEGASMASSD